MHACIKREREATLGAQGFPAYVQQEGVWPPGFHPLPDACIQCLPPNVCRGLSDPKCSLSLSIYLSPSLELDPHWAEEQELALDKVKHALTILLNMAHHDFAQPLKIAVSLRSDVVRADGHQSYQGRRAPGLPQASGGPSPDPGPADRV